MASVASAVASGWTIASPTTSLSATKILNSTDATYGSVGWTPFTNAPPWCLIMPQGVSDDQRTQPGRATAMYHVSLFVAIEHALTPATTVNYADLADAWLDQCRQVVASNFVLKPGSATLYPTAGDVRWWFRGGTLHDGINAKPFRVMGSDWYGVQCQTEVQVITVVTYQF